MNYQRLTTFVATALTWAIGAAIVFQSLPTHAQDSNNVTFRSRAELLANRRKVDEAFPEVIRALRTLHLPPHKIAEAETKLRLSESATPAARQELRALEEENNRQGVRTSIGEIARADGPRANLQQSNRSTPLRNKKTAPPHNRVSNSIDTCKNEIVRKHLLSNVAFVR